MLEHESVPGVVECMKITTATETKRLVHYAFQYAIKHGRKKVTLIHKAVSYIFFFTYLISPRKNLSTNTTCFPSFIHIWFIEHHEVDRWFVFEHCYRGCKRVSSHQVRSNDHR